VTKGSAQITVVRRNAAKSTSTLVLAQDGKALLPIVISAKASDATKATAMELSAYLKRITGAEFKIETGNGERGKRNFCFWARAIWARLMPFGDFGRDRFSPLFFAFGVGDHAEKEHSGF